MKNKLFILCLLILSLGAVSTPFPSSASFVDNAVSSQYYEMSETRSEETKWYYRVIDGRMQRRLWSITNEVWLTDWEWIS